MNTTQFVCLMTFSLLIILVANVKEIFNNKKMKTYKVKNEWVTRKEYEYKNEWRSTTHHL